MSLREVNEKREDLQGAESEEREREKVEEIEGKKGQEKINLGQIFSNSQHFLRQGSTREERKRQEMHQRTNGEGESDKTFMSPFFLSANARFEQVNMPFGIWFMECRVGRDERARNHFHQAREVKSRKGCFGGCPARLASAAIRENSIADSKGRSCALRASRHLGESFSVS